MKFEAQLDSETVPVDVTGQDGRFQVTFEGRVLEVDARRAAEGIWSLLIGGDSLVADVSEEDGVFVVQVDGETYRIRVEEETRYIIRTRGGTTVHGGQVLKAPMPGRVTHIEVEVGQEVQPGDGLIILEAMKMENEVRSPIAGEVKEVRVKPGDALEAGTVLVVVE